MILKAWDNLPQSIRNESTRPYYDSLTKKQFSLFMKRLFDILASVIMLILLSPVFLIVAIWIKADSSGPVFYRQERITRYGKMFRIFKFRTMVNGADKKGSLVTTQNDARITKVGEKIRKYRLDEIPQLINVLTGDMSFVGTRPEVKKYVDVYSDEMMATLLLPAGITSLASIEFKDEDKIFSQYVDTGLSIDEIYIQNILPKKMKYNLLSLDKFSFADDIALLFKTLFAVLK